MTVFGQVVMAELEGEDDEADGNVGQVVLGKGTTWNTFFTQSFSTKNKNKKSFQLRFVVVNGCLLHNDAFYVDLLGAFLKYINRL